MLNSDFKLPAILLFLIIFTFPAVSQETGYITIEDFLTRNNFVFKWSPILDTGELEYGSDSFSFKTGTDFMIFNYKEIINNVKIERKDGIIRMDKKTADIILEKSGFFKISDTAKTDSASAVSKPSGHRIAAILIDPGHGGRDTGAIGRHENDGKSLIINEKDIVLDISLELNRLLSSTYRDKKIILTRNKDVYPSLEERVEKANSIKLDKNEVIVFVSIHANASFNKNAKGFEVWYLPPDYRRDLIDADTFDKNTKDILPILNTMLEEEFTIESILLAQHILDGLDKSIGNKELNRGLKEETWFVVRNAKMPSVLVEVGFVSNKEEAFKLSEKEYLKKLTEGIYNGVKRFIDNLESIRINGE